MTDLTDILSRAEEAFAEYDAIKQRMDVAQAKLNFLAREYSLTTKTYAFQPYMLRKELNAWRGKRCA